jgi:hypothetical protein
MNISKKFFNLLWQVSDEVEERGYLLNPEIFLQLREELATLLLGKVREFFREYSGNAHFILFVSESMEFSKDGILEYVDGENEVEVTFRYFIKVLPIERREEILSIFKKRFNFIMLGAIRISD